MRTLNGIGGAFDCGFLFLDEIKLNDIFGIVDVGEFRGPGLGGGVRTEDVETFFRFISSVGSLRCRGIFGRNCCCKIDKGKSPLESDSSSMIACIKFASVCLPISWIGSG